MIIKKLFRYIVKLYRKFKTRNIPYGVYDQGVWDGNWKWK